MFSNTKVGFLIQYLLFLNSILLCNSFAIHRCVQGHKCVYYRGGQLLNTLNDPGYHFKIPFITSDHNVQMFRTKIKSRLHQRCIYNWVNVVSSGHLTDVVLLVNLIIGD